MHSASPPQHLDGSWASGVVQPPTVSALSLHHQGTNPNAAGLDPGLGVVEFLLHTRPQRFAPRVGEVLSWAPPGPEEAINGFEG